MCASKADPRCTMINAMLAAKKNAVELLWRQTSKDTESEFLIWNIYILFNARL